MAGLLPAYIGLYALLAAFGIREDARFGAPFWKAALSTVGNGLGIAGMILYARGAHPLPFAVAWRAVFALLVVQFAIEAVFELRVRLPRLWLEDATSRRWRRAVMALSLAAGLAFSIPYYLINYRLAFG